MLNSFTLGIPKHTLPEAVKQVLVKEGLMETLGQVTIESTNVDQKQSVQSMPACFRKLNINNDYKNDEQFSLQALDAKVIGC